MPGMSIPFPRFWYIVESREARDASGEPYSQWRIRKGLSNSTVETFERKTNAVDRAKELASNRRKKAGVVVATVLDDVDFIWTDNDWDGWKEAIYATEE